MSDEETTTTEDAPTETKLHRMRVGDKVEYREGAEPTGDLLTGEITAITNPEGTYVSVKFADDDERELTEEEIKRVP